MKRALTAATIFLAGVGSASATGGIACSSTDDVASVEVTIGSVPGMAVVGARIDVGESSWAMNLDGEQALSVSQAFTTGGHYWIDFADGNISEIVAEIRLHRADEDLDTGFGGTLRMPGIGAWTLVCFEG